jgi:hypothetical protein
MYAIQYEAVDGSRKMQHFDTNNRTKLLIHLTAFSRPIIAVYENSAVITKAIRSELDKWPCSKSRYAVDFLRCPA